MIRYTERQDHREIFPDCEAKEQILLAEDFVIVDPNTPSWSAIRPYVEAVLRLEQNEGPSIWHGWDKQQVET